MSVIRTGNVLKEISEPEGAVIRTSAFTLGDPTLSALEIWGAEYQESNALLVRPSDRVTLMKMAAREKCDVSFVGEITGDGKVTGFFSSVNKGMYRGGKSENISKTLRDFHDSHIFGISLFHF